jgi:uncharacterized FAD-dependent dehydrogenase
VNAEELCINGMSYSRRQSQWANAALVVTVNPSDLQFVPSLDGMDHTTLTTAAQPHPQRSPPMDFEPVHVSQEAPPEQSPLQGVYWQQEMERRAAILGGGKFVVPVQRVTDFLAGTCPSSLDGLDASGFLEPSSPLNPITSSYRLGVKEAPLHLLYPPFVTNTIRRALLEFERQKPGFISPGKIKPISFSACAVNNVHSALLLLYVISDAILHGVETRTSSPVQITRFSDSCESVSLAGLYPAGEGAGYAGGIASAAVDGLRVATAILSKIAAPKAD